MDIVASLSQFKGKIVGLLYQYSQLLCLKLSIRKTKKELFMKMISCLAWIEIEKCLPTKKTKLGRPVDTSLLSHTGDDSWVEKTLLDIKACLTSDKLPESREGCDYCAYWAAVKTHVDKHNSE